MARHKESWGINLFSVGGYGLRRSGKYAVRMSFTLDRDPDRILELEIDPKEAREVAENLLRSADNVDRLNEGERLTKDGIKHG